MRVEMASSGGVPNSLCSYAVSQVCSLMADGRVPPINSPLPIELSTMILDGLRQQKLLTGATLEMLTRKNFHIAKADLSHTSLSYDALRVLKGHPLVAISLNGTTVPGEKKLDVRMAVNQLVSIENKKKIKFIHLGGARPLSNILSVLHFDCLEGLCFTGCNQFENFEMDIICRYSKMLKTLDISDTKVTKIKPLRNLTELQVLLMHKVRVHDERPSVIKTLQMLKKLRVLDCSVQRADYNNASGDQPSWTDVGLVILEEFSKMNEPVWPYLASLDVAGYSLHGISVDGAAEMLTKFISLHSHLHEVSILDTPLDMHPYSFPGNREIRICNGGSRQQALNALSRYWTADRIVFTAHALQAVYYLLQSSYDSFTQDDLRTCVAGVVAAMRAHLTTLPIQMAGTACMYHLCKQKRVLSLLSREIFLVVERCLDAAEYYQNMVQLQKNVWLTLCNDYILQTDHIDFHRTCTVALESMVKNRDHSVSRMTIAIVSIVAPKVRTVDTKMLVASDQKYVSFFVKTINRHIDELQDNRDNYSQFTLKFTLSALWNLTDECPETCSLFLECGGLDASFRALEYFKGNASIQTKVLGLLNNLAEVPVVQVALLHPKYLKDIVSMLESGFDSDEPVEGTDRRMDMSYFAAGILSNLLSKNKWEFEPTPQMVDQELINTVSRWRNPSHTMVAYRSFNPFFALLERFDLAGVQMWAVWAINHVMYGDNSKTHFRNYSKMLNDSCVDKLFTEMINKENTHTITRKLIKNIIMLFNLQKGHVCECPCDGEHHLI